MGLPEFYNTSLPACHGLMTPADLRVAFKTSIEFIPDIHYRFTLPNV